MTANEVEEEILAQELAEKDVKNGGKEFVSDDADDRNERYSDSPVATGRGTTCDPRRDILQAWIDTDAEISHIVSEVMLYGFWLQYGLRNSGSFPDLHLCLCCCILSHDSPAL